MLSDDDFYSAEIDEMKKDNPELEEYDRVFRKIKEALVIEIQTTKTNLFDKMHELNNKTEQKFDQLYNSCDKRVRQFFDSKHGKKKDNEDLFEDGNSFQPPRNAQTSNRNTDKLQHPEKQREQIYSQQKTVNHGVNNAADSNNTSSQEYSDDVIFGFLVGSEEESEFLD